MVNGPFAIKALLQRVQLGAKPFVLPEVGLDFLEESDNLGPRQGVHGSF